METGELRHQISVYIGERAVKGFVWGENDCAFFANDMLVKFFNMEDVGAAFRHQYDSAFGAVRKLKELGYKSVVDFAYKITRNVNKPEVGDIAIHQEQGALGICLGVYSWFLTENSHLVKIQTSDCDIRRATCRQ